MVEIHKVREKRGSIGFLLRTRDRCDLTPLTLPPLLSEESIDVYWVDGSESEEGRARALNGYRDYPGLCEVHSGVNFGQMGSWIYGIRRLLQQGYEYLGFVEDDVLLYPGWLRAALGLYALGQKDGLNVGSVSARCIADRVMVPRTGYAVMGNIGCGMSIMKQEVFLKLLYDESESVLKNPMFQFSQIYEAFKELAGVDYPFSKRILKDLEGKEIEPGIVYEWNMSNDWWWEVILLRQGMVALAATPSFARNIDKDGALDDVMTAPTVSDPSFDWPSFIGRLQHLYENPIIKLAPQYQASSQAGT